MNVPMRADGGALVLSARTFPVSELPPSDCARTGAKRVGNAEGHVDGPLLEALLRSGLEHSATICPNSPRPENASPT